VMRILLRGALLSLSAVAVAPTLAGAINGNEWLTVPGAERSFYVMGVVDSWGGPVERCVNGLRRRPSH
jgi:hypothetical protein